MQNLFSIVSFIQILFTVFVKCPSDNISEAFFWDTFNESFYNKCKDAEIKKGAFIRCIKGESNPRFRFKNKELKKTFYKYLEKMSENNIEENGYYKECLDKFKEFYKKLLEGKNSDEAKKRTELILKILYNIIKNDYLYQSFADDLGNFCDSSEYNVEKVAPCLLDIFFKTLSNESHDNKFKDKNKEMLKKIEELYKYLECNPKKYKEDDLSAPGDMKDLFSAMEVIKKIDSLKREYAKEEPINEYYLSQGRKQCVISTSKRLIYVTDQKNFQVELPDCNDEVFLKVIKKFQYDKKGKLYLLISFNKYTNKESQISSIISLSLFIFNTNIDDTEDTNYKIQRIDLDISEMDKFDFNEAEILYSTCLDYLFFINKETCKFYYCYLNNENPKAIALNLNIPTSIKKVSVQDKIILPNTIQYGKNKNEKDECIEICNTPFENYPIIVEYEQDNFTRFLVIPFPNNPK